MRTLAIVLVAASIALAQQGKEKRPPQGNGVEVGKDAVDFKLKKLKSDAKEKDEVVQLSGLKGKPVVLVFGSYT